MKKICAILLTFLAVSAVAPLATACEGSHAKKTTEKHQEEVKTEEVQIDSEKKS